MGRVKIHLIKTTARVIFDKYSPFFTEDFNKNKVVVSKIVDVESKKIRNLLAGYITSLKKRIKPWEVK